MYQMLNTKATPVQPDSLKRTYMLTIREDIGIVYRYRLFYLARTTIAC